MSAPPDQLQQQKQQQNQQQSQGTMAAIVQPMIPTAPHATAMFYTTPETWTVPPISNTDMMMTSTNFSQSLDAGSFKPPTGTNYPESSSTDENTYPGTPEEWPQSLSPDSAATSNPMHYSTQSSPQFGSMLPPSGMPIPRARIQTVDELRRSKRRAQNRAAQHAFKERKRALEKELCEKIKIVERANAELRGQNEQLRHDLEKHMRSAADASLPVTATGNVPSQQPQQAHPQQPQKPADRKGKQRASSLEQQRQQFQQFHQQLQQAQQQQMEQSQAKRRKSSSAAPPAAASAKSMSRTTPETDESTTSTVPDSTSVIAEQIVSVFEQEAALARAEELKGPSRDQAHGAGRGSRSKRPSKDAS